MQTEEPFIPVGKKPNKKSAKNAGCVSLGSARAGADAYKILIASQALGSPKHGKDRKGRRKFKKSPIHGLKANELGKKVGSPKRNAEEMAK